MIFQRIPKGRVQIISVFGLLFVAVVLLALGSSSNNGANTSIYNYSPSTNKEVVSEPTDGCKDCLSRHLKTSGTERRREFMQHDPDEKCKKRLPTAIIVGIQKCGTTTLLAFLNDHPQIAACLSPAETKFFSMYFTRGLDWYKNLMPCSYSNQITMEKSPPYFFRRYSAEKIRKMNPKTKIIITVKEPVSRAVSMYAMLKEHKEVGKLSFEDYIMSNNRTKVKTTKSIVQFSNYQKHMKYWLDNFDLTQILFVDGQKFIDDPSSELIKVEEFLNIGSYFTPEKFVFNSTKGKHCLLDNTGGEKCMSSQKGRDHPTIQPAVTRLLQKYFKPLNEKFFKMIEQRFDWGY